uniref:Uncharacterized protein n=1 Tax=Oryza nivara TaxID=4536 RepID=A0A0E0HNW8_ORYNI
MTIGRWRQHKPGRDDYVIAVMATLDPGRPDKTFSKLPPSRAWGSPDPTASSLKHGMTMKTICGGGGDDGGDDGIELDIYPSRCLTGNRDRDCNTVDSAKIVDKKISSKQTKCYKRISRVVLAGKGMY